MSDHQRCEFGTPHWRMGPEDEMAALVFQLAGQLTAYVSRAVVQFRLTEPQALLIRQLRGPLPMRTMADRLHCDASNVTGIVDRLEARGLVERRTVPNDRRIKELVLTDAGRQIQEQLDQLMSVVPGLSDLSPEEQQALIRLLRRVLDSYPGSSEEPAEQAGSV